MDDAQEHSGLIFFPFTNNLLSSFCEMLSQEPWQKGHAQVVILFGDIHFGDISDPATIRSVF